MNADSIQAVWKVIVSVLISLVLLFGLNGVAHLLNPPATDTSSILLLFAHLSRGASHEMPIIELKAVRNVLLRDFGATPFQGSSVDVFNGLMHQKSEGDENCTRRFKLKETVKLILPRASLVSLEIACKAVRLLGWEFGFGIP